MKYLLSVILAACTLTASAQQEIKIGDAKNHVGDSVKIYSKIYGGKYLEAAKGSPTFLNLGGAYPDALVTVVISGDARKLFKKPPEVYYKGADVCVTGRIQMFNEKPEIIVSNPNQIQDVIMNNVRDTLPK
jgi:hypothetical protein